MRRWLLGAGLVGLLAGCGTTTQAQLATTARPMGQAQADLARYDAAVAAAGTAARLTVVGELTTQVGDWEPTVGGKDKMAVYAGNLRAAAPLPSSSPPDGLITWTDGRSVRAPLASAADALTAVQHEGRPGCDQCGALVVTGAELTTMQVQTARGVAVVPAWSFSLRGTKVRVVHAAIAPRALVTVTPPPWNPDDPPQGISIESATMSADERTLTVSFTGAPGPASQPCGADYTARADGSAHAVVVMVYEHPHGGDEACSAVGARRSATVTLDRPLGDRAVLEFRQGLPVPVTPAP